MQMLCKSNLTLHQMNLMHASPHYPLKNKNMEKEDNYFKSLMVLSNLSKFVHSFSKFNRAIFIRKKVET